MSIIILVPDDLGSTRPLLRHLQAQTIRRELELVFVVAAGAMNSLDGIPEDEFAAIKKIEIGSMNRTSQARAAGIRAATSPIVVLTEDHSLPEPEWAASLIQAHQGDWAVVGPAVRNGNPGSLLSWANFLIEYSEWLDPAPGGIRHHLPGHNSSYKKDSLRTYEDDLEDWLESESVLHWNLESSGRKLCLQPSARTHHFNFSRFRASVGLRFNAGRLFAGMRCTRWNACRRALYAGAFFLIPLVRLWRIWMELRRPGRPIHLVVATLPWMLPLLITDAIGEMVGYLQGVGDSARYITRIDFHREQYMCRKDRERAAKFHI